jgi:hypothetical protein
MSKIFRTITIAAALLGLFACNTTTFTSTWKAPGVAQISPVGKTVAAVFVTNDLGKRRSGEDLLAADLTKRGAHGVAAYTVVPDSARNDGNAALAALRAAGADAAVIMRIVGKDQQVNYTPGTVMPAYYGGFGPYWGYGWGAAYSPGTVSTDTIVSVETLVYSLASDKMLWASTSRTTNPNNLDSLISDVADATANEMVKQGFIAPPSK